jgi:predicted  nucleic acid-binding Zn-ribbon protein
MANPAPVTYEIRLKDRMTKTLKKMGLSVKSLTNRLKKGLALGLKAASVALKGFATAATAAGAAAAAIGFAAIRAGQSFLDAASRLEDTKAKFAVVFRGVEDDAEQMASVMAEQLGYGEGSIMGMMATLQDTLVPMGFARDEAMEFSGALTSLAADLTSFNPGIKDAEQAVGMLQSVLVGMHRSALNFGVVINEDKIAAEALALGLGDVNGELTEQEKVMVRVSLLMKGTADAQGDAINTAESYKNTMRALNEAITDVREELGTKLKVELAEAVKRIGGVGVIVDGVRTTFEFLSNVLTQLIIPTVANVMTNFSKFVTAMGGVDATIVAVSETVSLMGKVFSVMWDTVKVVFKLFLNGIDTISFAVKAAWDIIKILTGLIGIGLLEALRLVTKIMGFFYEGLDAVVIFIKDTAISVFQSFVNTIADVISSIGEALSALGEYSVVPDFIADAGAAASKAAAGMREFSASTEDLKGGESLYADISRGLEAFSEKLPPLQAQLKEFVEESFEDLKRHGTEFADEIMARAPAIEELYASIAAGAEGIGTDYEALAEKVGLAMEQLQDIEVSTPEQRDQIAALQAQLERLNKPLEDLEATEQGVAQAGMTLGSAFDSLGDAAMNFAKESIPSMEESLNNIASGAMASFANGMTDALMSIVDGSKSAGEAFKQFAATFLMDIARMIIQALVFKAIRSALGIPLANGGVVAGGMGELTPFANGGVASGGLGRFMPVKGYATGGPIVNKPHVALIGEGQHNEAVVPLPDGRSIPVDLQGTPETQVAINIEAVDGASVDRMLFDRRDTLRSIISTAIAESRSFRGAVARA